MSTYPRLEARVSAQERRQTILDARIEELSEDVTASLKQLSDDMKASFKQLAEYQVKTEQQIDTHLRQIDTRLDAIETTMATKEDITSLRAIMATKEELATMEARILDTLKQILTIVNPQHPPMQ